ncbi:MAG TPA: hypothetical protein VKH41_05410 [Myxococcota bacterium]|nr:hypothetical protein [Myxococcota bacterium]
MEGSRRRSPIRIVCRAALIAAVACGCAAPRNHLYQKSGAEFQRAVVLPLNLVAAMPAELADDAHRVDEALLGYLAEHGKAIESIGYKDALAAWRESESECRSRAAKDCDKFAGVAPIMAQHLRRDHDYQTLIIPYLRFHAARTGSSAAKWDGVKRSVEKTGSGFGPDGPARLVRGEVRAVSLKVFAFSAEGEKVFEGIGGLDLVDRLRAPGDGYQDYAVEVREDLFGDEHMVREGVELALDGLVRRTAAN